MVNVTNLNKEYTFSYPGLIKDDLYILIKNEFLSKNTTFVIIAELKYRYRISKIRPNAYRDNRHFFVFSPKLLGNHTLEVYKDNIHIDNLYIEVI
jgi:hypothetical protein